MAEKALHGTKRMALQLAFVGTDNRRLMIESIHAVFKVMYSNTQGTGAVDIQQSTFFITCSHVVPTNSIHDVVDYMKFKVREGSFVLLLNKKCHCLKLFRID